MKKFANNVVKQERHIDQEQWRRNVIDMDRVMRTTRGLFLTLEQSNEAMLRVCVEIVTCKISRKCIWWPDHWNQEEDKRDSFKKTIADKLKIVLSNVAGHQSASEDKSGEVADLKKVLSIERAKRTELEEALEKAKRDARELEVELRELRMSSDAGSEQTTSLKSDLKRLMQELKKAQEELEQERSARQADSSKAVPIRRSASCQTDGDPLLDDARKASIASAAEAEKLKEEVRKLRSELEERQKEVAKLKAELERCGLQAGEATNAELLRKVAAAEERVRRAEEKLAAAPCGEDAEAEAAARAALEQVAAERKALQEEKEKWAEEKKQLMDKIKALKEELSRLGKEKFEMLETMAKLKSGISRLKAIGEAKGLDGSLLDDILAESGVTGVVTGSKFNCFFRLYNDALRRIRERRESEQSVMAGQPMPGQQQQQQQQQQAFRLAPRSILYNPFAAPSQEDAQPPPGSSQQHASRYGSKELLHSRPGSHAKAWPSPSKGSLASSPQLGLSVAAGVRRQRVETTTAFWSSGPQPGPGAGADDLPGFSGAEPGRVGSALDLQGFSFGPLCVKSLGSSASAPFLMVPQTRLAGPTRADVSPIMSPEKGALAPVKAVARGRFPRPPSGPGVMVGPSPVQPMPFG